MVVNTINMHRDEFQANYNLAKEQLERYLSASDSSDEEIRIAAQRANEAWLKLKNALPIPSLTLTQKEYIHAC